MAHNGDEEEELAAPAWMKSPLKLSDTQHLWLVSPDRNVFLLKGNQITCKNKTKKTTNNWTAMMERCLDVNCN